jgi:hypothetical protein
MSAPVPWPWRRQPGESRQAYEAFSAYLRNDAVRHSTGTRSIRQTARNLGKSRQLLERWSTRWRWIERCYAYDDAVSRLRLAQRCAKEEARAAREAREREAERYVPFLKDLVAAAHLMPFDDLVVFLKEIEALGRRTPKVHRSRESVTDTVGQKEGKGTAVSDEAFWQGWAEGRDPIGTER